MARKEISLTFHSSAWADGREIRRRVMKSVIRERIGVMDVYLF